MKRMFPILAAALALAAPSLVYAQEFPPAPPIGDPKPFKLPATETFTLANGMKVTLIPYGIAPKTVVSLRVRAGSALEDRAHPWLAGVVTEMMKEGAGGRSAADVATAAAGMGGDLNVGAGVQTASVSMSVLSEYAPDAVTLVSQVAQRPNLPAEELSRVKANMARRLTVALSQPGTLADIALARTVYGPDHPYAGLPTQAQLAGYSIAEVKAFHAAQWSARRAHLYVAGRFDAAAVKAAAEKAFGGWAPGTEAGKLQSPHTPGPQIVLIDRPDAPQSTIRLAFDAPLIGTPEDIQNRVMNALLGGAFSSRITRNIREDKGYTYSPSSGLAYNPEEALWTFDADVTTNVTGAALNEVFKEVRTMQTSPPSADEAKGIRTYLAGLFAISNSTSGAVISTLASTDTLGVPRSWLDSYVPSVLAVTPAQMSAAAKSNLPLNRLMMVVVGDLKTVEPQLKALPELANVPMKRVTVP